MQDETRATRAKPLRCVALTKAGKPCKAFASTPDGRCIMHGPRASELHALGGAATSNRAKVARLLPRRLAPLVDGLEAAFYAVQSGALDASKGTAMAGIARAIVSVFSAGQLEETVRDIEAQMRAAGVQGIRPAPYPDEHERTERARAQWQAQRAAGLADVGEHDKWGPAHGQESRQSGGAVGADAAGHAGRYAPTGAPGVDGHRAGTPARPGDVAASQRDGAVVRPEPRPAVAERRAAAAAVRPGRDGPRETRPPDDGPPVSPAPAQPAPDTLLDYWQRKAAYERATR
jgi:hypothetical protein